MAPFDSSGSGEIPDVKPTPDPERTATTFEAVMAAKVAAVVRVAGPVIEQRAKACDVLVVPDCKAIIYEAIAMGAACALMSQAGRTLPESYALARAVLVRQLASKLWTEMEAKGA